MANLTHTTSEKILVTSALPYANGPIHFGHIAGAYLPADIFVRYHKRQQDDILYVCGTDDHGIANVISAEKTGMSPQEFTTQNYNTIKQIFDGFQIAFDRFSRTSYPQNHKLSQEFFLQLYQNGFISKKTEEQFYCAQCQRFLADRYLVGTCPACGHENARGDECGNCGKWLDAQELIEPRCKVCGHKPTLKATTHWYLDLEKFRPQLRQWIENNAHWKENVKKFVLNTLLKDEMPSRAITRDLKWGVQVPLEEAEGKVLYVWFDAPIGYISATMEHFAEQGKPDAWKDYWQNPQCRLIHFIGKDNIPFHTVVFPSMLMGQDADYNLPDNVPANEFLNLEGKQFSKSEGWYIDALDFLARYDSDAIRYTLTANMPETKDTEFLWNDFQSRNNQLADTFGNLFTRALRFIEKYFDGKVPTLGELTPVETAILAERQATAQKIGEAIDTFKFRQAVYELMEFARQCNRYFDEQQPWKTRKTDMVQTAQTLAVAAELIVALGQMAEPFMPTTAQRIWEAFGFENSVRDIPWTAIGQKYFVIDRQLGQVDNLFHKIDDEQIEVEKEKLGQKMQQTQASTPEATEEKIASIDYDDFMKLDLRVAEIIAAEKVEKSKKLILVRVQVGNEEKQVLAGIAQHYQPEQLIGKKVVLLNNLQPRKLFGIESQGMLLAASIDNKLALITPDNIDMLTNAKVQ